MDKFFAIAGWKTVALLFLIVVGFMGYGFPKYQQQMDELAGESLTILDARMSYTAADVVELFDKMGMEGRSIYLFISSKVDMIYPVVYGLFFSLLVAILLVHLALERSRWRWLVFLPLAAVIFDYLENVFILTLLDDYPTVTNTTVANASLMTSIKWISLTMTLLLIFWLGLKLFRKRLIYATKRLR